MAMGWVVANELFQMSINETKPDVSSFLGGSIVSLNVSLSRGKPVSSITAIVYRNTNDNNSIQ